MADTRFSHLFIPGPSDSRSDYRSPRRGGDGPRLRVQDRYAPVMGVSVPIRSTFEVLLFSSMSPKKQPKLEPPILVEDPEKSHHAPYRAGEDNLSDNKLTFGKNLLARKAPEQGCAGKVKGIYIYFQFKTHRGVETHEIPDRFSIGSTPIKQVDHPFEKTIIIF